uniref:Uncharacterized protein n=1 Tax=Otolemur garnettii TaxID=30611 RepID=H0XKL5_OTOGA
GPAPCMGLCCKPGGRDVNHSLVGSIPHPALRWDSYDKKVKQVAKQRVKKQDPPVPTPSSKPDLQVDLPRHQDACTHPGNPDCEESGESSSSGGSELHQLFCLEYKADRGKVTPVISYQGNGPGRV